MRGVGHTGRIKFGTESNGGFRNITISNCVFEGCQGLALETVDGALLEDITITNISMRDIISAPIFMRLGDRMRGPDNVPVEFKRVIISNLVCSGSRWRAWDPVDQRHSRIHYVRRRKNQQYAGDPPSGRRHERSGRRLSDRPNMRTCTPSPACSPADPGRADAARTVNGILKARDAEARAEVPMRWRVRPERRPVRRGREEAEFRERQGREEGGGFGQQGPQHSMPSHGFYVRHVRGIQFDNIEIRTEKIDRPAFVHGCGQDADFFRIKVPKVAAASIFALHNVADVSVHMCSGVPDTQIKSADNRNL